MLQANVEFLERKLAESEKSFNRLDQYNRRNNLEIQGIPSTVGDEVLEDKLIEIFKCINIPLAKSDIEDCHRFGKSNPKNTKSWICSILIRQNLASQKQIYFLMKI